MPSSLEPIHRTSADTAFVVMSTLVFGALTMAAIYVAWLVM